VTLLLANSSGCGGAAAACADLSSTQVGIGPAVQHAMQQPAADLDAASYASGRASLPVVPAGGGGGGRVRADRLVLLVHDVVGGRAATPSGPCLARISVHGRPADPATFC
jgi:hypothetical protein